MYNYPFNVVAPDASAPVEIQQRAQQDSFAAHAEYSVSNTTGVPTYSGVGDMSQVYQLTKPRKIKAHENIPRGAALNLFYRGNELLARLASSDSLELYCNAVAISAASAGNLFTVCENAAYVPVGVLQPASPKNAHVFLGKSPGTFSVTAAGPALAQLCGFTDVLGDFYFKYFPPVALLATVYTNDNNAY